MEANNAAVMSDMDVSALTTDQSMNHNRKSSTKTSAASPSKSVSRSRSGGDLEEHVSMPSKPSPFSRCLTTESARVEQRAKIPRSLTGDLNDIVNSVARSAGRVPIRPRNLSSNSHSPTSPRRSGGSTTSETKSVRISRQARNTKTRSVSPKNRGLKILQRIDREGLKGGPESSGLGGSLGGDNEINDNGSENQSLGASAKIDEEDDTSAVHIRRLSTMSSRRRMFQLLDAKNLTSFRDLNQVVVGKNNKPRTYMSRLFVTFQDCLLRSNLQAVNVTNRKLEAMAVLIHECMSGDSRNYHSVQHVFDISTDFIDKDPIASLAAMFHDCIYHNVDQVLSPTQEEALRGCFQLSTTNMGDGSSTTVASGKLDQTAPMSCRAHMACSRDPSLCMVETIFGYDHGQEITSNQGLNEFLSAVVAVRNLEDHLTKAHCAQIAVCIAATIPFKNKPVVKEEGTDGVKRKTSMQQLYDNFSEANDFFKLEMSDKVMVESIQRAALLANADVGNFGSEDIYWFLDNTWSLLTETNTTLRRSFLFTVMEFQHSLFKMNGFFHFLPPEAIFASFEGVPSDKEVQQKTDQARQNLELGKKYVGAKLLSASVLAAFAVLTGGDAPLSLFVGDLPSRHHQSQSINDTLPVDSEKPIFFSQDDEGDDAAAEHLDLLVYRILSGGRRSETSFDVKQSPLGAFLYAVVGDRGLRMILDNKTLYPMTEESAKDLLGSLPREVALYLAKTIASVAVCRAEEIMEVANNLPVKEFNNCKRRSSGLDSTVSDAVVNGDSEEDIKVEEKLHSGD